MKYWEFLIQKEGDQTWLPLEAQQVEILEGRYRVVAHTDRVDTPIDIWVSQLVTDELPPSKRIRKRTGKTNGAGLVVVMPHMHLKPGEWELTCSSSNDLDELTGESWQHHVQLNVFGRTEEDWSSEWPIPTDSETVASVLVEDSSARDFSHVAREELPLHQAQLDLETQHGGENSDAEASASARSQVESAISLSSADQSYRISLRQQAYLARQNQPMTIVGKVNALTKTPPEETSELWIRLQNPQTAQVIMEAHRPLRLARLPADFKVQIQLPAEISTRVILGEVSLKAASAENHVPSPVLASTAFTITAGIAQLLDTIANQDAGIFEEDVSVLLDLEASNHRSAAAPTLPLTSQGLTTQSVAPAVGGVLPPQLNRDPNRTHQDGDNTDAPVSHHLDLPTFGDRAAASELEAIAPESTAVANPSNSLPAPPNLPPSAPPSAPPSEPLTYPPMVSQPAQFLGTSILEDDLEADEIAAVLEDIDENLQLANSALDELEPPGIEAALPDETGSPKKHSSDGQTDWLADNQSNQLDPADSAESSGFNFQSLKLKDHFWQRLTHLTHEGRQEASQLAQNMKAAGVSQRRPDNPLDLSDFSDGNEIVVYDEPVEAGSTQRDAQQYTQGADSARDQAIDQRRAERLASLQANRQANANPSRSPSQNPESTSRPAFGRANQSRQPAATPPADLPEMALPVISVPMGDLVAGELVTITVRTRPSAFKPFIKLWMVDRQSRSLVIEPKLLTNLKPDALGDLEATTQMRVPMDCLDVQIAAITIDMATQQESSKAVVNRHIIPASQISALRRFNL